MQSSHLEVDFFPITACPEVSDSSSTTTNNYILFIKEWHGILLHFLKYLQKHDAEAEILHKACAVNNKHKTDHI